MTKFIHLLLLIFCLCTTRLSKAQQDVQFSHYMFNGLSYNPAMAGSKDRIDLTLINRNQWVGFEGAPVSQSFTVNAPINKLRSGLGAYLLNDKLGMESQLIAGACYAYQIPFQTSFLSLGLGVSALQKVMDGLKASAINSQDNSLPLGKGSNILFPDFSFGLLYTLKDFYVGLSFTHLNAGRIAYQALEQQAGLILNRHGYLTMGYEYPLTAKLDIRPSVLFKSTENTTANVTIDGTALLVYNKKLWGGIGYRSIDAITVLLGVSTGAFRLGYCYDINTSRLASFNTGTHEVIFTYQAVNNKRDKNHIQLKTPRFL